MKKKVWIMNHYATEMFYDHGGRHYWFAENLLKQGYEATVFCANTIHNRSGCIDTGVKEYCVEAVDDIPFVFVKSTQYKGNGFSRIKNMAVFAKNLISVAKDYTKTNGKPDVILASSVHPLTLVAGLKITKKFKIPCICEVRDLWPETLVEYGALRRNSLLAKMLYRGERWIYKKADAIIITGEGGRDYIIEKGWDKGQGGSIDLSKVHYINNGVDLEQFDRNIVEHQIDDEDLMNPDIFKVVYTGSIRLVNKVGELVEAARILHERGDKRIKFLIWGDGDEREILQTRATEMQLPNICFKGRVDKQYISYILSKSDLNTYILPENPLYRFGLSLNKSFEYFASGKPVLASFNAGYSIIDKYQCGKALNHYNLDEFVNEIIGFAEMPKEKYNMHCANARTAAQDFDFKKLTDDLIQVIESV